MKKGVYRNFSKFRGKHLCQSLFYDKVAGLSSYQRLVVQGKMFGVKSPGGNCPGGSFMEVNSPGCNYPEGKSPEGNFLGQNFVGGSCPGGSCPGGNNQIP